MKINLRDIEVNLITIKQHRVARMASANKVQIERRTNDRVPKQRERQDVLQL